VGPINVFKQYWQPELANAYARVFPAPLSFSFGYQWQPNRSDLLIATRLNTENVAGTNQSSIDHGLGENIGAQ
jgi:hypothetical protein